MANKKKEVPSGEVPAQQDERRNLEERIQDAKDSALRLWERTRSLQEKQGLLENRAKLIPWIAFAVLIGSVGLSAVITKYQLSKMEQQLAALQAASQQQATAPNGNLDQI